VDHADRHRATGPLQKTLRGNGLRDGTNVLRKACSRFRGSSPSAMLV